MDLVGLARVRLLTGEPERGCAVVAEAVPLLDRRQPGRLARKLGDFDREATRSAKVPAVRETRERYGTANPPTATAAPATLSLPRMPSP